MKITLSQLKDLIKESLGYDNLTSFKFGQRLTEG